MESSNIEQSTQRPLAGRVAIVSGGLGDIGRATAVELGRRGAEVAVGDVRAEDEAADLLRALHETGVRGRYDRVDVSDAEAVVRWVGDVERALATPTLVIVNAGIVASAGIRDVSAAQWREVLSVNLDGAFHLAQAAALRMLAGNQSGRIVFMGSVAGHLPNPNIPAYCVAKAALRMLCKCMALELAPHGILVNEVAPGNVDAGLSAAIWRKDPAFKEICRQHVPTGQLITADEVAQQVAHLCDPRNRQMTGSVLLMDGGLTLAGPQGRRP